MVIGFIVFVIVTTILKPLLERLKPVVDKEIAQFAKEHGRGARWEALKVSVNTRRVAFFASLDVAIRNAIKKRFSK